MIEHENILYIRDLSPLGGVETFIWEMVKKYQNYDIAVVYKTANSRQLARLKNYCVCYEHINQKIKCKTATTSSQSDSRKSCLQLLIS